MRVDPDVLYYMQNNKYCPGCMRSWPRTLEFFQRQHLRDKKQEFHDVPTCKACLKLVPKRIASTGSKDPKASAGFHNHRFKHVPWARMYEKEIELFFKNCPADMTVDHIIPIHGQYVSGLPVPWNMQYLTRSGNAFKGNHHESNNR